MINHPISYRTQFPYTIDLINSNRKWFRYDLIWDKKLISGFLNARRMPLRVHEHILVFYKKLGNYNPQFTEGKKQHSMGNKYRNVRNLNYGEYLRENDDRKDSTKKFPTSIISFQKPHPSKMTHPTEKPISLFEYLIKTYSNENDVIFDSCMGIGTTAVACKQLNRHFIGFEINKEYCNIADKRLKNIPKRLDSF